MAKPKSLTHYTEVHFHAPVGQYIDYVENQTVAFDKDMQMHIAQVGNTTITPDSSSSVSSESNSGNTRGPKTQYLFSDARGNEDTERAACEAERVRKYIADHRMGQFQLDSKTSGKLNLMVACFWYRWYELDMVDEDPQGAAIYRFLTNQCGLECSVMPKAFATAICKIINSGKKDPEIYDNLYSYFPELNKNNRN